MSNSKNKKINSLKGKRKNSKGRTNLLILVLMSLILLITIGVTARTLYIRNNCRTVSSSISFYMTSSLSKDSRLLKIKEVQKVSVTDDTAEVIASGTSHKSPHKYSYYTVYLTKSEANYWKLDKITSYNP